MSPAMRQYLDLKRGAEDAILFFRMGDFYEMFFEDARRAAAVLNIALTSRQRDAAGEPIPMAGVPHHAAETYIGRLVRAGFRVAVCDQIEPAGMSRGPVAREIVRVATPSTYLDPDYLEAAEAAYLMAVAETGGARPALGAAFADLSTGDFCAAEFGGGGRFRQAADAMAAFRPRELLAAEDAPPRALVGSAAGETLVTRRPGLWFGPESAREALLRHFGTASLEPFGIEAMPAAAAAAGAAVRYLGETQRSRIRHLVSLRRLDDAGRMVVDRVTVRNLEIFDPLTADAAPGATLAETLDRSRTGMGSRLLRRRLAQPRLDRAVVEARHEAVEEIAAAPRLRSDGRAVLTGCPDLERLAARASLRVAGPREYLRIAEALTTTARLRALLDGAAAPLLGELGQRLRDLPEVRERIERAIDPEAPALLREGGVIRTGLSPELDGLRRLRIEARGRIRDMEARERARTGIRSLRIRYSQVFGYTIEVRKGHDGRVPDDYTRRQTLVAAERYVTTELKEFEERVARADDDIRAIEARLFAELEEDIGRATPRLQETAAALGEADLALALAAVAAETSHVRPTMHDGFDLTITGGRHPVVEAVADEEFVPNDLRLDEDGFLMVLTGPNMGGKSTYLRQAALIAIMAQAGCLVPARTARLPLVDRVFARVGATDDLSRGRSTFLTEMEETAHILHHATRRSLVLLDEVGRGTATYDGVALAWALVEHIVRRPELRMKTLFATHYHELTSLAASESAVVNFHVEAREHREEIVFLRQVLPGGTSRSYGIQVARLAGVPLPLVNRALEVLRGLDRDPRTVRPEEPGPPDGDGLGPRATEVIEALRRADPDGLTPRAALDLVYRLRRELEESPG